MLLLGGCRSGSGSSATSSVAAVAVSSSVKTTETTTATAATTQVPPPTGALVMDGGQVSTTVAEVQWREQAAAWLKVYGDDLSAISAAAQAFGAALQAKDAKGTVTAINDFLAKVGKTEVDLPPNAFGHDLMLVMNDYVEALSMVRQGVVGNDQHSLVAGSDALSVAVAKFGVITARVKSTS